MSSKPQSKSKTTFQGQEIKRMPRSELDDRTMRGLSRQDKRLDHQLKSVEKARGVVLKSLDSDAHIFMKGGNRYTNTYSLSSKTPNDPRQRRQVTSFPPSKYQPDVRNKKSIATSGTQQQPASQNKSAATAIQTGESRPNIESGSKAKHVVNNRRLGETKDPDSTKNDQSVGEYNNTSNNIHQSNRSMKDTPPKTKHPERQNSRNNNNSVNSAVSNTATTPSGFTTSSGRTSYSNNGDKLGSNLGSLATNTSNRLYDDANNNGIPSRAMETKESTSSDKKANTADGTEDFEFFDDICSYGKRPAFWDYLSAPKNPSRSLQKREQLEREFSSASLKQRATTPAAKSAKGPRTGNVVLSAVGSNLNTKPPPPPSRNTATSYAGSSSLAFSGAKNRP